MASLTMYGAEWCADCRRSKSLLDGLGVDYEYVDTEVGDHAQRAQEISGRMQIPVIVYPDGAFQVEPSDADVRDKLVAVGLLAA